MKKQILSEIKIGEDENMALAAFIYPDGKEVEFIVSTYEVSSSYLFGYAEWEEFVKCVNMANRTFKDECRESSQ